MPNDELRWEASPATTQQGTLCALQVEVPSFQLSFQAQFHLRPQQSDHIFEQLEDFLLDFVGEFGDDAEPLDCHGAREKLAEVRRKAQQELEAWQERLKASDVMKAKVDRMAQQINSMRTAHLKEVTWLKEQVYSKAKAEKEGRDYRPEGEVHFHSARLAFEEEVNDLASERLVAMRTDFEIKMRGMEEKYNDRLHLLTEQLQTAKMLISRKDKLLQALQDAVPRDTFNEDPQEGSLESPRAALAACESSEAAYQSVRQASRTRSLSGDKTTECGGEAPERTPEELPPLKMRPRRHSVGDSLTKEGLSSKLISPPSKPPSKKTGAAIRHACTKDNLGRRGSAPNILANSSGVVDVGVGTGPYEEFFPSAVRLADAGSQTSIDQKLLDQAMRYCEKLTEDAWSNLLGRDGVVEPPDHEAAIREPDYEAVVLPLTGSNQPVDEGHAREDAQPASPLHKCEKELGPTEVVGRASTPTTTGMGGDERLGDRAPSCLNGASGCRLACVGGVAPGRDVTTVEQEIQCNMQRVVMMSPLERWLRCDEDPVEVQLQQIAEMATDVENKVEEMSARAQRLMGQATVSQRERHQAALKRLARLVPDAGVFCGATSAVQAAAAVVQDDPVLLVPATGVEATRVQMARALAVQERSMLKAVGQEVSDILTRHGINMAAQDVDTGSALAPTVPTTSANPRSTWRSRAAPGRRSAGNLDQGSVSSPLAVVEPPARLTIDNRRAPSSGTPSVSELPARLTADHQRAREAMAAAAQTVSELPARTTVGHRPADTPRMSMPALLQKPERRDIRIHRGSISNEKDRQSGGGALEDDWTTLSHDEAGQAQQRSDCHRATRGKRMSFSQGPSSPGQAPLGDQPRGDMVPKLAGGPKPEGRPSRRPSIASMASASMVPTTSWAGGATAKPPESARGPRLAGPSGDLQEADPEDIDGGSSTSADEMTLTMSLKPKSGRPVGSSQRRRSEGDVQIRSSASYAATFQDKFKQRVHFTRGSEACATGQLRSFTPMAISALGVKQPRSFGSGDIDRDRTSAEDVLASDETNGASFALRDNDKDKVEFEKEGANGRIRGRRTSFTDKVAAGGVALAVEPALAMDAARKLMQTAEPEAMADMTQEETTSPPPPTAPSSGASHTPRPAGSLRVPSRLAGAALAALPPIAAVGAAAGGGAGGHRHSATTPRR